MDSAVRRAVAVGSGAALLVLVVVGAAVRGPLPVAFVVEPQVAATDEATDPYALDEGFGLPELLGMEDGDDWSGLDLSWIGSVGALLLLVAMAFVLFRLIRRYRRIRVQDADAAGAADMDIASEDDALRIPVLLRGVDAARALLDEHADPGDAVVAAWLALEDAAHDAGLDRHPAQTPAEFTVTVLAATGADDGATRDLLELYHRARFSTHGVSTDDVARARECLGRIAASWPTPIEVTS